MTASTPAQPATAHLSIDASRPGPVISRHIYGHFAEHLGRCVHDGVWVGPESPIPNIDGYRKDIVEGLQAINIPNLRWPGGCFADQYHWKEGVGPADQRPEMVNLHWGMVTEDNSFGTHEFLGLCELVGTEPYLAGNVGSGTVQELEDWVEYCNRAAGGDMAAWRKANGREAPWKVKYWGIGNENWGCGGHMTPERYADLFKTYATFVMDYGDARPFRIACGANGEDYNWTEVMMANVKQRHLMQGLSLHYYTFTGTWQDKGAALEFTEEDYMQNLHRAARMDEIVAGHSRVMDRHDPGKAVKLIVDEWGNWWNVEPGTEPPFLYQQNTLRDALTAGLTLNILNSHADRVHMANIAQLVNVLQALFLAQDEKTITTPTYHVFDLYQVHFDARLLPLQSIAPDYVLGDRAFPSLSASASLREDGAVGLTLCNLHPRDALVVECDLLGTQARSVEGRVVTAPALDTHNSFDAPGNVVARALEGATITAEGKLRLELPARSVVALTVR